MTISKLFIINRDGQRLYAKNIRDDVQEEAVMKYCDKIRELGSDVRVPEELEVGEVLFVSLEHNTFIVTAACERHMTAKLVMLYLAERLQTISQRIGQREVTDVMLRNNLELLDDVFSSVPESRPVTAPNSTAAAAAGVDGTGTDIDAATTSSVVDHDFPDVAFKHQSVPRELLSSKGVSDHDAFVVSKDQPLRGSIRGINTNLNSNSDSNSIQTGEFEDAQSDAIHKTDGIQHTPKEPQRKRLLFEGDDEETGATAAADSPTAASVDGAAFNRAESVDVAGIADSAAVDPEYASDQQPEGERILRCMIPEPRVCEPIEPSLTYERYYNTTTTTAATNINSSSSSESSINGSHKPPVETLEPDEVRSPTTIERRCRVHELWVVANVSRRSEGELMLRAVDPGFLAQRQELQFPVDEGITATTTKPTAAEKAAAEEAAAQQQTAAEQQAAAEQKAAAEQQAAEKAAAQQQAAAEREAAEREAAEKQAAEREAAEKQAAEEAAAQQQAADAVQPEADDFLADLEAVLTVGGVNNDEEAETISIKERYQKLRAESVAQEQKYVQAAEAAQQRMIEEKEAEDKRMAEQLKKEEVLQTAISRQIINDPVIPVPSLDLSTTTSDIVNSGSGDTWDTAGSNADSISNNTNGHTRTSARKSARKSARRSAREKSPRPNNNSGNNNNASWENDNKSTHSGRSARRGNGSSRSSKGGSSVSPRRPPPQQQQQQSDVISPRRSADAKGIADSKNVENGSPSSFLAGSKSDTSLRKNNIGAPPVVAESKYDYRAQSDNLSINSNASSQSLSRNHHNYRSYHKRSLSPKGSAASPLSIMRPHLVVIKGKDLLPGNKGDDSPGLSQSVPKHDIEFKDLHGLHSRHHGGSDAGGALSRTLDRMNSGNNNNNYDQNHLSRTATAAGGGNWGTPGSTASPARPLVLRSFLNMSDALPTSKFEDFLHEVQSPDVIDKRYGWKRNLDVNAGTISNGSSNTGSPLKDGFSPYGDQPETPVRRFY